MRATTVRSCTGDEKSAREWRLGRSGHPSPSLAAARGIAAYGAMTDRRPGLIDPTAGPGRTEWPHAQTPHRHAVMTACSAGYALSGDLDATAYGWPW